MTEAAGEIKAEGGERPRVEALDAILGERLSRARRRVRAALSIIWETTPRSCRRRASSYGKGTKRVSEDRGLIRYLMRHEPHHAVRDVRDQAPRPRADGLLAAVDPPPHGQRQRVLAPATPRRSTPPSDGPAEPGAPSHQSIARAATASSSTPSAPSSRPRRSSSRSEPATVYEHRLERGVAREQARKDLPLSTYTEAYWKVDLHNLLHFLQLRMDSHAQ